MQLIRYVDPVYGTITKRPSSKIKSPYVADVTVREQQFLAHCPSLGLGGIIEPGVQVLMTASTTKSKTDYVVQAVKHKNVWVGNVPLHANRIVKELIESQVLVSGVQSYKAEYTYGDSRFDFLIETDQGTIFCEVKSVHIQDPKRQGVAVFPVGYKKRNADTVSERANKHVAGLTDICNSGKKAMIVFVVQREDCNSFAPNRDTDPTFSKLLDDAQAAGVAIKVVYTSVNDSGIYLERIGD